MTDPLVEVPEAVAGSWHDAIPGIASAAITQLRLAGGDMDAALIASKAPAACVAIDQRLDLRAVAGRVSYTVGGVTVISYAAGTAPADVLEAATQLTVELYRRKDAAFGVLGAWTATGEAVRVSSDQLRGIDSLLAPWVEGRGLA